MVSRVQLSATTSRPLVLRQDPDADLSRYTTTGKGKTHGGMTTGDSHMGFKTASTVCPIKSQLIQLRHRQTKGAATDMVDLTPPRHISTLPNSAPSRWVWRAPGKGQNRPPQLHLRGP